jgi:hypothetical protein
MEKLAATLAMECCHEVVPHGGGGGSCSTFLCTYGFTPMWDLFNIKTLVLCGFDMPLAFVGWFGVTPMWELLYIISPVWDLLCIISPV